jgi:hypothetical protein
MKLASEQAQKLLRDFGIRVTDACDKCGQLLGSIRWMRTRERSLNVPAIANCQIAQLRRGF